MEELLFLLKQKYIGIRLALSQGIQRRINYVWKNLIAQFLKEYLLLSGRIGIAANLLFLQPYIWR